MQLVKIQSLEYRRTNCPTSKIYGHKNVHYIPDLKILSNFLLSELKQGDMLITIGAGNISKISQLIKEKLEVPINNKI